MTLRHSADDDWIQCTPGAFHAFALKGRRRRRRRSLARSAGLVLLAAVGLSLWRLASVESDHRYAGVKCREVRNNLPAFVAGTLQREWTKRLRDHLDQCPHCRSVLNRLKANGDAASMRWKDGPADVATATHPRRYAFTLR